MRGRKDTKKRRNRARNRGPPGRRVVVKVKSLRPLWGPDVDARHGKALPFPKYHRLPQKEDAIPAICVSFPHSKIWYNMF